MERQQRDAEERDQQLLQEQVEKAAKEAEERGIQEKKPTELQRTDENGGKIKLNMSFKPVTMKQDSTASTAPKLGGNKMRMMMKGSIKKPETPKHMAAAHR